MAVVTSCENREFRDLPLALVLERACVVFISYFESSVTNSNVSFFRRCCGNLGFVNDAFVIAISIHRACVWSSTVPVFFLVVSVL